MTPSITTVSLAFVVAALAAGCAADSQPAAGGSNEAKAPPEYRTGSNIPVREPRTRSDDDKGRTGATNDTPRRAEPAGKATN